MVIVALLMQMIVLVVGVDSTHVTKYTLLTKRNPGICNVTNIMLFTLKDI